jgi:hypothetical protein
MTSMPDGCVRAPAPVAHDQESTMTATKAFDYLVRIAGVLALLLGLALWGGRLYDLINLHMVLGVAVVIGLWGLAALVLRRGGSPGLALGAAALGLATLALGPTQTRLLPGDLHWLVQVAHLLLGLGAIALGAVLARSLRSARA